MNIVTGSQWSGSFSAGDIIGKDLGYDYPYDLNIRPGSDTHEKIKNEVLNRARESHSLMSNRFDSWNQIEQVMTAYIGLDDDEEDVQDSDSRKPVSIVFPYTYIIIETLLTYLMNSLLGDPIFKYEGTSPEDLVGSMLLEKVIQKQCDYNKVALSLHTFLRDSITYGIGACAPYWKVTEGLTFGQKPAPGIMGMLGRRVKTKTKGVIFEGNALDNIDPYLYLPDPKVPAHKIQDGEYVGWVYPTSRIALLREEKQSNSDLFNVKYLKDLKMKRSSIFSSGESARGKKSGVGSYNTSNQSVTNPVDVIYMYIDLVPKDWELGDSEYPEKWLFGLAADEVVVKAKKLGLAHGMFPIVTAAPDFDGYSVLPTARSEMLYGMQHVLSFLFNSHVANVRKSINDVLVVDPYLINISDLKDPKPGAIVRMRRPAWGKGVKDAVQQLQVNDITRNNLADSSIIVHWMQMIGAIDESMMGSLRQGGPERLTGAEFQGTRAGAISRLERVSRVIGMQAFHDLGIMFASHTQQLMSQDVYVNTVGRWQEDLQEMFGNSPRMKVTPYDLMVSYDVEVKDGSIPSGPQALWVKLFDILSKNQAVGQQFNMEGIFEYVATIMGAKNIKDFKIKPKIMPNEQIAEQAQAGNIVPIQQGGMM